MNLTGGELTVQEEHCWLCELVAEVLRFTMINKNTDTKTWADSGCFAHQFKQLGGLSCGSALF